LGIPGNPSADNFFNEVRAVFDQLGRVSWTMVAFSAVTIVALVGLRRIAPRIPGPLVAVVGGIVLVAVTSIEAHGLALIARVPSGLPTPVAPAFDHLGGLLPGAFGIAIMVFLETLAVARSVRQASEPAQRPIFTRRSSSTG
jgi:sulfate permease, SulP family